MSRSRSLFRLLRRPGRGDDGFGLLEMLVVLLITGSMGVILVSMAGQFRPLRERQQAIEQTAALEAVLRHVTASVESAELLPVPLNKNEPQNIIMLGTRNTVYFNAVMRRGALDRTLSLATIRVQREKTGGFALVETLRDFGGRGTPQTIVLAKDIAKFKLSYDGQSRWKSADGLPKLIEIEIAQRIDGSIISAQAVAVPRAR